MRAPGSAPEPTRDPLAEVIPDHAPAGQLFATLDGSPLFSTARGEPNHNAGETIAAHTLFDLASITKLFTALAVMKLAERGALALDAGMADVLSAFGADWRGAWPVTWRALLTHTSGLPACVELGDVGPERARNEVLGTAPNGPAGTVRYSDVGFMLLGFGIEAITALPLDRAIDELVIGPAGLSSVTFYPDSSISIAPTELVAGGAEPRLRGQVHDENARALGGVAGHAGLFGTATDLARLGTLLLANDGTMLAPHLVDEMTREQAVDHGMRRGLGFSLWSPDLAATSNPFGPRAFGHTGFTGTSLWIDPGRRLAVALLTNAVYRGRDFEAFFAARSRAHRAIVAAADAAAARRVEASS